MGMAESLTTSTGQQQWADPGAYGCGAIIAQFPSARAVSRDAGRMKRPFSSATQEDRKEKHAFAWGSFVISGDVGLVELIFLSLKYFPR